MRIVALLATYQEERFVGACIEHLASQGVDVYLIDNGSTDRTVEIALRYRERGLVGHERFARHGVYSWRPLLERKEELALELDADWFLHVDADEIRLPPPGFATLADAFADAGGRGFNAAEFSEFTFVPTQESPDHDHERYRETMRFYYPYRVGAPVRLNAWRRRAEPVGLASSGGHRVSFPDLRLYPRPFRMRHYLFLSREHALRKYVRRHYDPSEVAEGWHRGRAALRAEDIALEPEAGLRRYISDDLLDPSSPRRRHPLFTRDAR